MNTNPDRNEQQSEAMPRMNQPQGFVGGAQVYKTRDGEALIHKLHGNTRIVLPMNLYKKILGVEFTPKEATLRDPDAPRARIYGFISQPEVFLSRDKKYLIHKVPGVRIVKPVAYYKKVLGISEMPESVTL
jgi:hypothetical protein